MDLSPLSVEELWKLAYEQEQNKNRALTQIIQLNENIKLIIEEINRKEIARISVPTN